MESTYLHTLKALYNAAGDEDIARRALANTNIDISVLTGIMKECKTQISFYDELYKKIDEAQIKVEPSENSIKQIYVDLFKLLVNIVRYIFDPQYRREKQEANAELYKKTHFVQIPTDRPEWDTFKVFVEMEAEEKDYIKSEDSKDELWVNNNIIYRVGGRFRKMANVLVEEAKMRG